MTELISIPRNQRRDMADLIYSMSEAVFNTEDKINFMEEFVPVDGRVPAPKVRNFANFMSNTANLLWAVKEKEKGEIIGFMFISDLMGRKNIFSIGISKDYANQGHAKRAFQLMQAEENIPFPIVGETSIRNFRAIRLMESLGFERIAEFEFFGEPSYRYQTEKKKLNQLQSQHRRQDLIHMIQCYQVKDRQRYQDRRVSTTDIKKGNWDRFIPLFFVKAISSPGIALHKKSVMNKDGKTDYVKRSCLFRANCHTCG